MDGVEVGGPDGGLRSGRSLTCHSPQLLNSSIFFMQVFILLINVIVHFIIITGEMEARAEKKRLGQFFYRP